MKVDKIILTRDVRKERKLPVDDTNTDVIVWLTNGDVFIASFFTYKNISLLKLENQNNGKFLNGSYFWAFNMILIESCEANLIKKVITELIIEGDFKSVFRKI